MNKPTVRAYSYPLTGNSNHWVDLLQAFLQVEDIATPVMDTDTETVADYTIARTAKNWTGRMPGEVSVDLYWGDLHHMAAFADVRKLLDPKMLSLTEMSGWGNMKEYFADLTNIKKREIGWNENTEKILRTVDIFLVPCLWAYNELMAPLFGNRFILCPHVAPERFFWATLEEERCLDVLLFGNISQWYPLRTIFDKKMREHCYSSLIIPRSDIYYYRLPHWTLEAHQSMKTDLKATDYWHTKLAGCLRHSKIVLVDGCIENVILGKYFESMGCGCLVMGPLPREAELLGLEDGKTMVAADHIDFLDKIKYYLKHDDERQKIAEAGYHLVHKYHTPQARAKQVICRLEAWRKGTSIDSKNINGPVSSWTTELS